MLTAILILLGDLALGGAAFRLAKSNEKQTLEMTKQTAVMQALLSQHGIRLDGHETRIVALEAA